MNIELVIRNLAKSNYFQNLYHSSKEVNGIHLFTNINNFSGLQSLFLYWLRTYSMMYEDLANKESQFLTENVINDHVRADAYLYYKRKKQERELNKYRQEKKMNDMGVKDLKNTSIFEVEMRGK